MLPGGTFSNLMEFISIQKDFKFIIFKKISIILQVRYIILLFSFYNPILHAEAEHPGNEETTRNMKQSELEQSKYFFVNEEVVTKFKNDPGTNEFTGAHSALTKEVTNRRDHMKIEKKMRQDVDNTEKY